MESERPIEKLLRACALKRRREAELPSEVHPATRRLLQGEVARQFGEGPRRRPQRWWSVLAEWPRLAWAGAAVAVLLLAGLALLVPGGGGGSKPELLAKNDQLAPARSLAARPPEAAPTDHDALAPAADMQKSLSLAESKRPMPAEVAQQSETAKDKALILDRANRERNVSLAANQPRVLSAAPNGTVAGSPGAQVQSFGGPPKGEAYGKAAPAAVPQLANGSLGITGTTAPATGSRARLAAAPDQVRLALSRAGSPTRPHPASTYFFSDSVRGSIAGLQAQEFVRSSARAEKANAPVPAPVNGVLASFKVEPAGNTVRIVDADGSVYSGSLRLAFEPTSKAMPAPAPATTAYRRVAQQAATDAASSAAQRVSVYTFHVVGTNRTLDQMVQFSGTLWPPTNVIAVGDTSHATALVSARGGGSVTNALPVWLPNSRISGKAIINGREQIEINATAKTP